MMCILFAVYPTIVLSPDSGFILQNTEKGERKDDKDCSQELLSDLKEKTCRTHTLALLRDNFCEYQYCKFDKK